MVGSFKILAILFFFITYTSYKVYQLWPELLWLAFGVAVFIFVLMMTSTFVYRRHLQIFETPWFQAITWVGSFTMALWATYIMISIPLDIVYLVSPSRFGDFFRELNFYILLLSSFLVGFGFAQVVFGPVIERVTVKIPGLSPSLEGFKIVQISDLHVGPTIRSRYVGKVVRKSNLENPDLVVMTGDIVDAHAESVAVHLQALQSLTSKYGTYYTTGNHEYYWGVDSIIEKLEALGITALLNSNKILNVGKARVLVGGVTDPVGRSLSPKHVPNTKGAVQANELSDFKILLAHRPDACIEAEVLGFDLQFSGHTHAGQFFPFSLLIGFAHKYTRGLYQHGRMWVYVNPGTGYWGPANRFAVQSEITVLTLASESAIELKKN